MSMDLELRGALRSLVRSPGYLATVVVSLALGIGGAAAAFGVIGAVRLRALPFPDGNRLVVLGEVPAKDAPECRASCDVSYETYANVLRLHPPRALDVLAAYTAGGKTLGTGDEPLLVLGGIVTPNVFPLLKTRPALGRGLSEEDDRLGVPLVTVLSHALWTSQFGSDPAVVGKTIKLSDSHYTVVGVMPAGFDFELRSQFWLPVVPTLDPSTRPSIRSLNVIGRLAPGRTLAQLNAELATIDPTLLVRGAPGSGVPMRVTAATLRSRYAGSTQSHDLIFAGIVACVLLIACANVANLVLVRTLHQLRELAVRSALGRTGTGFRGLVPPHPAVARSAAVAAADGDGIPARCAGRRIRSGARARDRRPARRGIGAGGGPGGAAHFAARGSEGRWPARQPGAARIRGDPGRDCRRAADRRRAARQNGLPARAARSGIRRGTGRTGFPELSASLAGEGEIPAGDAADSGGAGPAPGGELGGDPGQRSVRLTNSKSTDYTDDTDCGWW